MDVVILIIVIAGALFVTDRILSCEREDEISEDELHRSLAEELERELMSYGAPEGADHLK